MRPLPVTVKAVGALSLLLALLVILNFGSSTAGRWQLLHADNLLDGVPAVGVAFTDIKHGWALTVFQLLETNDGGQIWERQRSGNKEEVFFGVACISPERASAVGQDGLILQTGDGGKTWSRQDSGATDNLVRARFFDDSGWIVGGSAGEGTLLRTRDGGATWERVPLDASEALFDIYINGQQGWIVGANGTILHTSDGGQSWQQERSPIKDNLVGIFFLNPQQGWISGDKRTILRLSD